MANLSQLCTRTLPDFTAFCMYIYLILSGEHLMNDEGVIHLNDIPFCDYYEPFDPHNYNSRIFYIIKMEENAIHKHNTIRTIHQRVSDTHDIHHIRPYDHYENTEYMIVNSTHYSLYPIFRHLYSVLR